MKQASFQIGNSLNKEKNNVKYTRIPITVISDTDESENEAENE
jgi:hypothetical protein